MILSELKLYVETSGAATRAELAKHFRMSEDGVDAMMNVWVEKGKVTRCIDTNQHQKVTRVRYKLVEGLSIPLNVTV
ncbi:FeoC-like transcriptional regulator [Vibrio marisflavi]|uniref:Transcriptional regulator HTH-type FeoC domain-containing protein n=1 Tax=Vibrio marisflavi CECT 7928 TaxID=634439 RepID=A0ABN8E5I5_9VIBR|nr:FeoC-like transcriptional regulator [Vibrio marisflavi]CAH0540796.1 hypothetical protein VMF7928_03130 [Vibrio marisflavi CECT 7928]